MLLNNFRVENDHKNFTIIHQNKPHVQGLLAYESKLG